MHHHGQKHGFEKFHRHVVIEHDPEREVVLIGVERYFGDTAAAVLLTSFQYLAAV